MANALGRMFGGFRSTTPVAAATGTGGDDDDSNLDDTNANDDGDESDQDDTSFLADLFKSDDSKKEGDDDDDDDDEDDDSKSKKKKSKKSDGDDDDDSPSAEEALATEIAGMLKGITIPEDVIPADFDPSDPKQFRDVVGKIQQQTAQATLAMAMRPMAAAMQQMQRQTQEAIRTAVAGSSSQNKAESILAALVPEVETPEHADLVRALHAQAMKKTKNPTDAARAVRRGMDAMGFKNKGGSNSDPSEGGFRSGDSALDAFAPLRKPKAAAKK